jgi:hypothetical protein
MSENRPASRPRSSNHKSRTQRSRRRRPRPRTQRVLGARRGARPPMAAVSTSGAGSVEDPTAAYHSARRADSLSARHRSTGSMRPEIDARASARSCDIFPGDANRWRRHGPLGVEGHCKCHYHDEDESRFAPLGLVWQGGRHRTISDRACLAAIVYMARTSTPGGCCPPASLAVARPRPAGAASPNGPTPTSLISSIRWSWTASASRVGWSGNGRRWTP